MPTDYKARLDELDWTIDNEVVGKDRMERYAKELLSIARELLAERDEADTREEIATQAYEDECTRRVATIFERDEARAERDRLREGITNLANEIASYGDPGDESMAETIRSLLDAPK